MEDTSQKQPASGGLHLIEQDIHMRRVGEGHGAHVIAEVACLQRGCEMDVSDCAGCPHFVRIEIHEAGYLLLCRSGGLHEPPKPPADHDPDDPG